MRSGGLADPISSESLQRHNDVSVVLAVNELASCIEKATDDERPCDKGVDGGRAKRYGCRSVDAPRLTTIDGSEVRSCATSNQDLTLAAFYPQYCLFIMTSCCVCEDSVAGDGQ